MASADATQPAGCSATGLADGSIRVYFDDMNTPIMEATDKAFGRGLVGFGSFDDVGRYRNIKIHSADHRPSDKKIFR